jgi:uncharacterized membrane protein YhiD involved in acid resistance
MKSKFLKILSILTVLPFITQLILKQRKKSILRKKILAEGNEDYKVTAQNIANSISKSKDLYKELIVKIHPDRFQDERRVVATELSAKITTARRNYNELSLLKIEVEKFLDEVRD